MRPTYLFLPLASLLLCPCAAAAAEPSTQPVSDPAKPEKQICKREVIVGSRLPGPRTCRTSAQWKQESRDSQDMVDKIQRDTRGLPGGL